MKNLVQIMLYTGLFFTAITRANVDIQPGMSGAWIADGAGQGAFINIARVNDRPNFVITWYSYLDDNQVWLIGSLPFDYGVQQISIPMTITSGTSWGANFVSNDVDLTEWGTINLNFIDCNNGTLDYTANDNAFGSGSIILTRLTNTDGLSCHENSIVDAEKQSLIFMREEEKMARDAYLEFNRMYDQNVFVNIAQSEQTHMDAVLNLMNIYNVPDSSTGVEGTFNNPDLQALYHVLIEMGTASLGDAYLASALIEETDIYDLMLFEDNDVISTDILATYDNLLCGSRNHLRSFVSKYEVETGNQYVVQLPELSDEVAEILASNNEQCGQ